MVESIGSTEYQKAVSNVSELRRNIELARQGFLDKDKVVNQYNETIGKTTGQVSTLDQAEQALNKNANNYIRFTFLKAVANTALQKSAELAAQAAADALKNPADNREFGDYGKVLVDNDTKAQGFTTRLKGYANTLRNTFAGAGLATLFADTFGGKKLVTEQAADRLKKNSKDLMDQSNIQKRIFDDFEAQAARLAKENGFNFFQDNSSASGSQALQQRLQAVNALIEAEKRRNDLVQENESSTYEERIQSSKQFLATTTELINKRKEIELTAEKLTNDGRKAIRQSALNDVKAANIQSLKEQQKVSDEIDAELKKTYDSQIALAKEKDRQTIESLKAATEQQIELINSNRNAAVLALEEQRANGEISESDYQQQLTDIEFQAAQDRLQLQIYTAKRIIEIRRAAGQDVGNEEKALADLQIKIDNSVTEERIKNLQKYAQARKDLQKLELQLAQEAANLIASIVNAGFEAFLKYTVCSL